MLCGPPARSRRRRGEANYRTLISLRGRRRLVCRERCPPRGAYWLPPLKANPWVLARGFGLTSGTCTPSCRCSADNASEDRREMALAGKTEAKRHLDDRDAS